MKFALAKSRYLRLLFLITLPCLSQTTPMGDKDLSSLSYDELYEIMVSETDSILIEKTFEAYVVKASESNDTLELAQAFRLRSYNLDFSEGIKSVDSSMAIAKTIHRTSQNDLDKFMALAHYTKGALFYKNDMNYEAVEECIKCYRLAKKTDSKKLVVNVLIFIADIKSVYGQEDEAVLLQRKTLEYLEKNKSNIKDYGDLYFYWTEQMSRGYLFSKELDSAAKYIDIGISLAKKNNDITQMRICRIQQAKLNYYLGNFQEAEDALLKYIDNTFDNQRESLSMADDLYYLGMIAGELGNDTEKKRYFLSIDSIIKINNYPLRDNFNEIYQFLLKQSIAENNASKTDEYLNRVVYYDSLLLSTQKKLREITLKKFDLPMQEEEKQLLGNMISSKSKWLTWFYFISGVMLIGLTAYYVKYTKVKKRLTYVMGHRIDLESPTLSKSKEPAGSKLDEEVASKVLGSLEEWEERKGFLDNALTQQKLAKELNTNSTYLSQIINTYKNQNFATYLKDLRITYAVNDLKENAEIVKTRSMIHIAEMYGFNSIGVFSQAFKDKIGVTPGAFFKKVLKTEQKKTPQ